MASPVIDLFGGFKMPVVGLGTWQSDNEEELEKALDAALEIGYRHIDTAFAYKNEHVIGRVLKKWFASGTIRREDLFVVTKLPMEAIHPERVVPYLKKSLEALQLEYVDLYLLHFPVCGNPDDYRKTEPTDHIAVWKKMEEQVDAGRTKTIGLSNFTIKQISNIIKNAMIKPASLQIEVHVFLQQNDLVKFAQDNGIAVVAYSPLSNPNINNFYNKLGIKPKNVPSILTDPTIKSIADKHGKTPAQVALKFLLQRNIVVIPKSVTVSRLKENIDLFGFTLDKEDMKALAGLEVGESCRVCDWCISDTWAEHEEFPFPRKSKN